MRNIKKGLIHTLPGELILLIVDFLDLKSLSNFRWTCKALRDWSEKRFSHYFRRRRFIFSPYSMQALVDIANHPVLGRELQSVFFGTFRYGKGASGTSTWDPRPAQQRRFIKSGSHFKLLCEALYALKRHRTSIELGIFDDRPDCHGLGHEKMYASHPSVCSFTLETMRTIETVVKASRECDLPFTSWSMRLDLGLYTRRQRQIVDRLLVHLIGPKPGLFGRAVPIDLSTHDGRHQFFNVSERRMCLSGRPNSTELYRLFGAFLRCSFIFLHFMEGVVHPSNKSMYLKTLELSRCEPIWSELEEVVDAQAQTLRVLKMSDVCMLHDIWALPYWDLFLGKLSRLESLTLEDVTSDHVERCLLHKYVTDRQHCTGQEDIQARARDMLTREDADCLKALEAAGLSGPVNLIAKKKVAALRYLELTPWSTKAAEKRLVEEFGLGWNST